MQIKNTNIKELFKLILNHQKKYNKATFLSYYMTKLFNIIFLENAFSFLYFSLIKHYQKRRVTI